MYLVFARLWLGKRRLQVLGDREAAWERLSYILRAHQGRYSKVQISFLY